jgi:hypothetical protein
MRGSIFLAPAAIATRLFAATSMPLEKHARRLEVAGIDWPTYERMKATVLEAARAPLAPAELEQALADAGHELDGVSVMPMVRLAAMEGLVLRIGSSLRSDSLRYVAAEAWLGAPLADKNLDPDAALRWLAAAYLQSYGPARVKDFAWWCGSTQGRARQALEGVGADLGGGLLLPRELHAAFHSVEPIDPSALDALPKWDAYTMGYAPDGRQRLVDDAHLALAYSGGGGGTLHGDGFPLLLSGGRAVARWAHKFAGQRLQVRIFPFGAGLLPDAVESAFDAAGQLLGASAVEISRENPAG